MLDVEVIGSSALPEEALHAWSRSPASAGVEDGHIAVEFVDAERIAALNAEHRGVDGPTDVLVPGRPRRRASRRARARRRRDLPRAHRGPRRGRRARLPHLVGMDHETDHGEMLALQAEIMSWVK